MDSEEGLQEALKAQEQRPMLRFAVVCPGLEEALAVAPADTEPAATVAVEKEVFDAPLVEEKEFVAELVTAPLSEGAVTDHFPPLHTTLSPSSSHTTLSHHSHTPPSHPTPHPSSHLGLARCTIQ